MIHAQTSSTPGIEDASSASGNDTIANYRRQNRIRFALFIKVLFKLIDNDKPIRERAKCIVQSSIRRSKDRRKTNGAQNADKLSTSKMRLEQHETERKLRDLVGDSTWLCASHYTQLYFQQRQQFPGWKPTSTKRKSRSVSFSSTSTSSTQMESCKEDQLSSATTNITTATSSVTLRSSEEKEHLSGLQQACKNGCKFYW